MFFNFFIKKYKLLVHLFSSYTSWEISSSIRAFINAYTICTLSLIISLLFV